MCSAEAVVFQHDVDYLLQCTFAGVPLAAQNQTLNENAKLN
jgi:hypothetical protein